MNADGDASAPNGSTDGSSSDADGNGGVGGWAATVAMFLKRFSLGVISAMGPALAALREAWASSPEEVAALLRETDRQSLETVHERLRELVSCYFFPAPLLIFRRLILILCMMVVVSSCGLFV